MAESPAGQRHIPGETLTAVPSEVMTIQVLFHLSGVRAIQKFYGGYVCKHLKGYSPVLVSYKRIDELSSQIIVTLVIYLKTRATGHMVDFMLTRGNTDDRQLLKMKGFIDKLFGKLFGDEAYLSKALFEDLLIQGIHLVTKLRKNMNTKLVTRWAMTSCYASGLSVRPSLICLKNIFQIDHCRHQSPRNSLTNLFLALIAYNITEKKPSLKQTYVDTGQLLLFKLSLYLTQGIISTKKRSLKYFEHFL